VKNAMQGTDMANWTYRQFLMDHMSSGTSSAAVIAKQDQYNDALN